MGRTTSMAILLIAVGALSLLASCVASFFYVNRRVTALDKAVADALLDIEDQRNNWRLLLDVTTFEVRRVKDQLHDLRQAGDKSRRVG